MPMLNISFFPHVAGASAKKGANADKKALGEFEGADADKRALGEFEGAVLISNCLMRSAHFRSF